MFGGHGTVLERREHELHPACQTASTFDRPEGFVTYTYFWHGRPILQERAGFIGSWLLSFLGVFLLANALLASIRAFAGLMHAET